MIATVTFPLHGESCEAILSDEGQWSCPDELIQETLNTVILTASTSPAEGRRYWRHAQRMAEKLGGTVAFAEKDPGHPGEVY